MKKGITNSKKCEKKRYDTQEKRIKFLRKKGNIITFKEAFYPKGTADGSRLQIITNGIKKDRSGAIKILGQFYDSRWYNNLDELLDAVNWDWMEKRHG